MLVAVSITQNKLGELIGTDGNTVSRWERGVMEIKVEAAFRIAVALNVSVAFLLGETEDPKRYPPTTLFDNERGKETHFAWSDVAKPQLDANVGHIFEHKSKPASLEDVARTREALRNVKSLDERDLNAAEEMLLASLEAIHKERAIRAAQQNGATKSA